MFKRKKVFISHKRNSGQATTEAILIKNSISSNSTAEVFMDVTEDYLGAFPKTLKDKIQQSDIFVLILPPASDYEYLCNADNWVYKEIHYALTYKDAVNKPSRIVPVTFDRNFSFPPKEDLKDIAELADYSFLYFDTNDKDSVNKLLRALGLKRKHPQKIILLTVIATIIVVLSMIFYLLKIPITSEPTHDSHYNYDATIEFVTTLDRLNTFNLFTDSCGTYVNNYLSWYLNELNEDPRNLSMNKEFNVAYVKEYCVRLIVMSYLAFSYQDLDRAFDSVEIGSRVEECYDNIPENARYPISIKQMDSAERTQNFDAILDVTISTLNADPQIQSVPENMIPILKTTLKSKLWPY